MLLQQRGSMDKPDDGKPGEEAISAQAEHWRCPWCGREDCVAWTVEQWRFRSSDGEREGSVPPAEV